MKPIDLIALSVAASAIVSFGCGRSADLATIEQAKTAFEDRNFRLARELCDKAIESNSEDSEAYLLRGRTWLEEGNVQQAIKDYSLAIRFRPLDADPYYFRADAYAMAGDEKRARWDRRSAHENDPDYKTTIFSDREQELHSGAVALNQSTENGVSPESSSENSPDSSSAAPSETRGGFDPLDHHWRLQDALEVTDDGEKHLFREDDPRDRVANSRKTVLDQLRESKYADTLPAQSNEDLSEKLDKIRRIGPQLTTPSDDSSAWLSRMKEFENSNEIGQLGPTRDEDGPSDGDARSNQRPSDSDEDTKEDEGIQSHPARPPLVAPYHRRWITGPIDDPTGSLRNRADPAAPYSQLPFDTSPRTTGIQSGRHRRLTTTTAATEKSNTLTSGALRLRQWTRSIDDGTTSFSERLNRTTSKSIPDLSTFRRSTTAPPVVPGASQSDRRAKSFRRTYLVPPAGAGVSFPRSPNIPGTSGAPRGTAAPRGTGIQSGILP